MKTIYFFDVDNTLFSHANKKIMPQTLKLLKEIGVNKDNILCIATGRSPRKLDVLDEIIDLVDYIVFLNGAIAVKNIKNNNDYEILDHNILNNNYVKTIIEDAMAKQISCGVVSFEKEVFALASETAFQDWYDFQKSKPLIQSDYHLSKDIYQVWLWDLTREEIKKFMQPYKNDVDFFYWHHKGCDIVAKNLNKSSGIKTILEALDKEQDYQLICIGDGHNDRSMINIADISVAMGNSSDDVLKKEATLVAPHIDEDKLYDFFIDNNLLK